MALSDYLKGPQHKARSMQLEVDLADVRHNLSGLQSEMDILRARYGQLQELAKKYGAMEAAEVQRQISEQRSELQAVREAIVQAKLEAAAVTDEVKQLRDQVLVVEETLLLESFALYLPKFKLTSTAEYRLRLDQTREKQKAMIKAAATVMNIACWRDVKSATTPISGGPARKPE